MLRVALVLLLGRAVAHPYAPVTDTGRDSKVHKLALFALAALKVHEEGCEAKEDSGPYCGPLLRASGRSLAIEEASQQIVSGVNYRITCRTDTGSLRLRLYEQWWTQTLSLESATMSVPVGGASLAIVDADVIQSPLSLDFEAFRTLEAVSPLLLGGAPLTDPTFGGHYTGSDSLFQPFMLRPDAVLAPSSWAMGGFALVVVGGLAAWARGLRLHSSANAGEEPATLLV